VLFRQGGDKSAKLLLSLVIQLDRRVAAAAASPHGNQGPPGSILHSVCGWQWIATEIDEWNRSHREFGLDTAKSPNMKRATVLPRMESLLCHGSTTARSWPTVPGRSASGRTVQAVAIHRAANGKFIKPSCRQPHEVALSWRDPAAAIDRKSGRGRLEARPVARFGLWAAFDRRRGILSQRSAVRWPRGIRSGPRRRAELEGARPTGWRAKRARTCSRTPNPVTGIRGARSAREGPQRRQAVFCRSATAVGHWCT